MFTWPGTGRHGKEATVSRINSLFIAVVSSGALLCAAAVSATPAAFAGSDFEATHAEFGSGQNEFVAGNQTPGADTYRVADSTYYVDVASVFQPQSWGSATDAFGADSTAEAPSWSDFMPMN
jgi:hypothetical protein